MVSIFFCCCLEPVFRASNGSNQLVNNLAIGANSSNLYEQFGILANDSWIHWDWEGEHWFGGVDKDNPRIEIVIKRFRHPKEDYRENQETANREKEERKRAKANKVLANTDNGK